MRPAIIVPIETPRLLRSQVGNGILVKMYVKLSSVGWSGHRLRDRLYSDCPGRNAAWTTKKAGNKAKIVIAIRKM